MAPGQRQSIPVPIGHRYLFKRFSTKLGGHLLKPLSFIMKRVWTLQRVVLLSYRKLFCHYRPFARPGYMVQN